ncbi:BPSL0761 family protein [Paraburkholderia sp. MM6662-R1]|uniref:BPSL0761 family protein n=1 Tax=Paraburkholderia sp. MM6662-R1 TaxID=2991066 RepID=UPI003D1EF008
MTTPAERTKAVVDARDFLQMLSNAEEVTIRGLVQSVAIGLLRHYPSNVDLDASASALPGLWAHPIVERPEELTACTRVVQLFATRTDE